MTCGLESGKNISKCVYPRSWPLFGDGCMTQIEPMTTNPEYVYELSFLQCYLFLGAQTPWHFWAALCGLTKQLWHGSKPSARESERHRGLRWEAVSDYRKCIPPYRTQKYMEEMGWDPNSISYTVRPTFQISSPLRSQDPRHPSVSFITSWISVPLLHVSAFTYLIYFDSNIDT